MQRPRPILRTALALTALVATACATTVTLPALPQDHPANPDAPAAARARPSDLLAVTAPLPAGEAPAETTTAHVCPMHPEVRSEAPGSCPICGMALVPAEPAAEAEEPAGHHQHGRSGGGPQ